MSDRRAYTLPEAAEQLTVCLDTLRSMIARGEIQVRRIGQRRLVVPASELDRILEGS